MYCSNCGKYNSVDSKFCQFCGARLTPTKTTKNINEKLKESASKKVHATKEELEKLQKRYKDTSSSSVALSIFSLVVNFISYLANDGFATALISAIQNINV